MLLQQQIAMQINFDHYVRNFRMFYQQLTKGHTKQDQLNKQFKALIQTEIKKWRKGFGLSKISETSSDNPLLNRIRENRKNKQQIKLAIQIYYSSSKLQNCVVFGYLYLVFEHKNIEAFQFLQQQLREPLSDKETYSPQVFRKMNYVWSKFSDIINGKRKTVRFDKQLQEYFKELPQIFLDLLYKVILQGNGMNVDNKQMYFREISQFLTLKIEYFELSEQQNIKNYVYGQQKKLSLKIGYIKADKQYVNVLKIPQKQQRQLNKQITLEKFEEISNSLNDMYTLNMKDYMNLSNLKHRQSNPIAESRQLTTSRNKSQDGVAENSQFVSI